MYLSYPLIIFDFLTRVEGNQSTITVIAYIAPFFARLYLVRVFPLAAATHIVGIIPGVFHFGVPVVATSGATRFTPI